MITKVILLELRLDNFRSVGFGGLILNQGVQSIKWSNSVVYLKGLDGKTYLLGNINHAIGAPSSLIGFEPLLGLYDTIIPDWSL